MINQILLRLFVLAGVLSAGAGSAIAQTTNCTGSLAPGNYAALNVPAGQTCSVSSGNVSVSGNVTVRTGASLIVRSPANFTINSSLLAVDASNVLILASPGEAPMNILGSVSVTGSTGVVTTQLSFIGGTLSAANSSGALNVFDDSVAGNVLVRNNQIGGFGIKIGGNAIGGSLVCTGNASAPINSGSPNAVGGNEVGQCSGL